MNIKRNVHYYPFSIVNPFIIFIFTVLLFTVNVSAQTVINEQAADKEQPSKKLSSNAEQSATATQKRQALLKQAMNEPKDNHFQKSMTLTVSELTDNGGLVYIGGKVSQADLSVYLNQLNELLGEEFYEYRANQSARDHNSFHLTLINPYEYQTIDKAQINLGKRFNVTLLGLGTASKSPSKTTTPENQATFYVVAQSNDAQFYRQQFALPAKDFHITLGFKPSDIYGVGKGVNTLIQD